jgi:hypothetical protein
LKVKKLSWLLVFKASEVNPEVITRRMKKNEEIRMKKNEEMEGILLNRLKRQLWQL